MFNVAERPEISRNGIDYKSDRIFDIERDALVRN